MAGDDKENPTPALRVSQVYISLDELNFYFMQWVDIL